MNGSGENLFLERQRLAWIVLLASFFICFVVTIAVPVGIGAALQNMKQTLPAIVQANQGTVRVDTAAGESAVVISGEGDLALEPGGRVLTDETSTASLFIYPPDDPETPLSRLQIYSRSAVTLKQANAPRFSMSDELKQIELYLDNGRLQLIVPEDSRRPIAITVNTPYGTVSVLEPGQYAILVDNEATRVSVQAGQAEAVAGGQTIRLTPDQRAEVFVDGEIVGPLTTSRDLVSNGDFQNNWDHWSLYVWNIELADQPEGQSRIVELGGEPAVQFLRDGIGHADVRMRQVIGQDVADYEALRLLVTFRIASQSLGVCGVQGSECPLFLRINYSDDRGVKRTWQQGFFAQGEISPTTPDACISCAVVQDTHQRAAMGQINFYETDLLEELARQGAPLPQFIDDVTLVSSGHSFQVEILDVSMMVEE
jgi:hypothetical protein